ncbi:MAG: hypothetical protein R2787_09745 [Saprospiraceae bacterium]
MLTQKTKFVGAASDSLNDQIYGKNAIITTCDADVPHYGIRSTFKQKIIPDKSVIIGPSNLEINQRAHLCGCPSAFSDLKSGRPDWSSPWTTTTGTTSATACVALAISPPRGSYAKSQYP